MIAHADLTGAVNVTAPKPLSNKAFMEAVRAAAGMPVGLAIPAWLLALGAMVIRTETELVLKSRRVVPGRIQASGYAFQFRDAGEALVDLLGGSPSRLETESREAKAANALGHPSGPVNCS